ncbi:MAG: F0F1 ATP synthase subunit alpha [Anaerolineaceae bacterium]|nr:F0F1 ATP synthase subunit alpha [Anaerolineaceae bacterium]
MSDLIQRITSDLQQKIDTYRPEYEVRDVGMVDEAGDGIARVRGLSKVRSQELVEFANGVMGIAFNLEETTVGVIILGDYSSIKEGMIVSTTNRIASVPVGDGLVGRVVNAIGEPIDGKGPITSHAYRPIERIAPGVVFRQDVDTPVQTGVIAIDSMIPIGRGQRELIIGDRQTGKSALALDTIINQKGKNLICIYVAIGAKKSAVARNIAILEKYGAMEHTVVVLAAADEPAAMQYIAPYAGCSIGEEFMENGRDALVIYDDLSKHAWAYREVSLLIRRPPGREAYPGDLFYLHSRLLERAARMADDYVIVNKDFAGDLAEAADAVDGKVYGGPVSMNESQEALKSMPDAENLRIVKVKGSGGSLTALPIIETLLGDVSAYVPTNVISITDGQIYLENDLFNAGIRPAINVGISVSRVGGSAQTRAMRQVAGRLRMDMASYRSLAAFAQFGSDLDKVTQSQLNRGQRLQEVLKQTQYKPYQLDQEVILLFAGTNGFIDTISVERVQAWKEEVLHYMEASYPEIGREILAKRQITPETDAKLRDALKAFNLTWL